MKKYDGLANQLMTREGVFINTEVNIGIKSDSHYEYLLKQWIQTGMKKDDL